MRNRETDVVANKVQQIAEDVQAAGVRRGGVLLVHSSLSAMGHVPGGAETVVRGLIKALGSEGTLLMPALSYEYVTVNKPVFDVRYTPSNVGAIPEHFRTRPGTWRSVHPTHSVCGVGPLTQPLLEKHYQDNTPCGRHSPFHRLPEYRGQILMLGCGLRPNTSMHGIEELVDPPYLFGPRMPYQIVLHDGYRVHKVYRTHGFMGWAQRYDRVADVLDTEDLRRGTVLNAEVYVIEAVALWNKALIALHEDPFYFVEART
jgi:aminoglycoside 3-N-acetyltransferase